MSSRRKRPRRRTPPPDRPLSGRLILASASPRRRSLLREAGFHFIVVPSRIPERLPAGRPPVEQARQLALRKARAIARRVESGWVLGADTIVVAGRRRLGKPASLQAACRMLQALQGTRHKVITGVALVQAPGRRYLLRHAVSFVTMRPLSAGQVRRLARKHADKAGAYAVQDRRDPVVRKVEGSTTNVVGLPMEIVRPLLRKLGADRRTT